MVLVAEVDEDAWRVASFARAHSSLSANTLNAYSSDVRLFAEWVARSGVVSPAEVTRTLVRRYIAHLSTREFARRSIARKAASVRRYFVWAVAEGMVDSDPTIGLHVAGGSGRMPACSTGASSASCSTVRRPTASRCGASDGDDAVLEILYGSGLRVSELCGLELQQVRVDEQALIVWGKGARTASAAREAGCRCVGGVAGD